MKNLKKVLSLVLVLAMACGLFVTASAVDYVDEAEIQYTTAVDVLSGIGILEGVGGDKFMPKANVTRAAAAKIIAYLLLGKDSADALSTNVAPFSDVPAGHWAAGYVQYCVNQGIINGKGNNMFKPLDNVTNAEFAKMLLVALGYGVNDEFVGATWMDQVTKYAARVKLFDGNYAANPKAAATREEAALYAFNILWADKVIYSALFGDYLSNATIAGGAASLGTFADDYDLGNTFGTVTYNKGYVVDGVVGVDAEPADLGRFALVWYQTNAYGVDVAITAPVYLDTVLATKYDGSGAAAWTNKALPSYVAAADTTVNYYLNGVLSGTTAPAYAKGDKVEIIDTDGNGKFDKVLVTTYTAGVLGTKDAATSVVYGDTYVTLLGIGTVGTDNFDTGVLAELVEGYEDLKARDVVYWTKNAATGKYYFTKATPVAGQKTAQVAAYNMITFGGAPYTASGIPGSRGGYSTDLLAMGFNTDATLFLDAGGYVIAYTEATVSLDYAVLIDAVKVVPGGLEANAYIEGKLLYTDGTTEIVKIASINGTVTAASVADTNKFSAAGNANGAYLGGWYTYYTNAFGQYVLASTGATGGTTVTNNTAKFDGINTANEKTVFVVAYTNSFGGVSYTTYTGYTAIPSSTAGAVTVEVINNGAGITVYAYVDATGDANYGSVTNYAFITNKVPTTYAAGAFKYDSYSAIIDGQAASINILNNTTTHNPYFGIYTVTYDTNGYATLASAPGFVNVAAAPTYAANGTIVLGGNSYAYTGATVAYIVNGMTGAMTVATVEDIALSAVTDTTIKLMGATGVFAQIITEIYVVY